jgi:hypothetical protein
MEVHKTLTPGIIGLLSLLVIILGSCTAATPTRPAGPLPEYVVILTPSVPYHNGRCTGIALDAWHILTADHCFGEVDLRRVMTQYGQEARVTPINQWPEVDAALLRTNVPLILPEYATFAAPDLEEPAEIYGGCEFFLLSVPRRLHFVQEQQLTTWQDGETRNAQQWRAVDLRVCGGDSGGPVIQNGKVIGLTHAVLAEILWIPYGANMFLIPADDFVDLLEDVQVTLTEAP